MAFEAATLTRSPPLNLICANFAFPRGCPQPLKLSKALEPCSALAPTQTALQKLQTDRDRLVSVMSAELGKTVLDHDEPDVASAEEVIHILNSYIPRLFQLALSLEVSPEAVHLGDMFVVEWPSALTRASTKVKVNRVAEPAQVLASVRLEIAHAMIAKAFELIRDAQDVLGENCVDAKGASVRLREAAGVFEYLAEQLDGEWASGLNAIITPDQRPVETKPDVCRAFREYCLGVAQQLAVAQSLKTGNWKATLMSKLSLGVIDHLKAARDKLEAHVSDYRIHLGAVTTKSESEATFPVFLDYQIRMWESYSYIFMAFNSWDKEAYGQAITYAKETRRLLSDVSNKKLKRLTPIPEKFTGQMIPLAANFMGWQGTVASHLSTYEKENKLIYYSEVPALQEAEPLPTPTHMMKPTPVEAPESVPLQLAGPEEAPPAAKPSGGGGGLFNTLNAVLWPANKPVPTTTAAAVVEPEPPSYNQATGSAAESAPPSYHQAVAASAPPSQQAAPSSDKLEGMGFPREKVQQAMQQANGDENAALEILLKGA